MQLEDWPIRNGPDISRLVGYPAFFGRKIKKKFLKKAMNKKLLTRYKKLQNISEISIYPAGYPASGWGWISGQITIHLYSELDKNSVEG